MTEDMRNEIEVKSRLLDKMQGALDTRIREVSQLEKALAEKITEIGQLKKSYEELLAEKTAEIGRLKQSLDNYETEIDHLKNLLSYRIGRSFGSKLGNAPGITAFEKVLSNIFGQNYDELSNSRKTSAQTDKHDVSDAGQSRIPDTAPQADQSIIPQTSDADAEPAAAEWSKTILDELSKPKLPAEEHARLVTVLEQRLASVQFAHGESMDMSSQQIRACVDSKSGMLDEWELACLCLAIRNFDWKKNDYLIEIGTNVGSTAIFMAKILQEMKLSNKIISIDPFSLATDEPYNPKGNYHYYITLARQQDVHGTCIPVTAFSQGIPHVFKKSVGVLLVDGSHQYRDVKTDLERYAGLLRTGGYVFMDDYHVNYPGVYRAFEEWLVSTDNFELSYKGEYFVIAKKTAD